MRDWKAHGHGLGVVLQANQNPLVDLRFADDILLFAFSGEQSMDMLRRTAALENWAAARAFTVFPISLALATALAAIPGCFAMSATALPAAPPRGIACRSGLDPVGDHYTGGPYVISDMYDSLAVDDNPHAHAFCKQ